MRNFFYILMLLMMPLLTITYSCGSTEEKDTVDSVYSVLHINTISIDEPEKALAILDTAEQRGLMSRFDIARLRCLSYHNGLSDYKKALQYGLEAYNMPEARNDAEYFLHLVEMIADEYYQSGDYTQSVKFCTEGLKTAKDSLIRTSEANLNVALGISLLELNRPDEAFGRFNDAMTILDSESKKSDIYMAADDYVYAIGMIITALCDEKRYDEAIALLPQYEEAVNRLETKKLIPDGLADMRRANGYAAFSYILALKGETEKAKELYQKLCATAYSKSPADRGFLLVPYLLASKKYSEALYYLKEEKEYWQSNADTVSYEYIDIHLMREQEAYEGLDNVRECLRVSKTIQQLNDTLRKRDHYDKALELAEIYKTKEQALQIERQSASITIRNIVIVSSVVFLLLAVIFIIRILRYNRTINHKNRIMVKTIDELMIYKDNNFELQEEIIQLQKELNEAKKERKTDSCTDAVKVFDANTLDENKSILTEVDRSLFVRMNHEVLARKLFLNPDFTRKDLIAEFKISANKFSLLFKEFANCSFSQYIQDCRIDYAVKLMREYPQWSLETIAKESCMSNGAFYNHFNRRFGMSPANFKAGEASISTND